jgi:hypothetical protein
MRFFLEFLWLAPNVTTSGLIEGGREKFYCRRGEEDAVAVQSFEGCTWKMGQGVTIQGMLAVTTQAENTRKPVPLLSASTWSQSSPILTLA